MPTYEYRCPQGHTFDLFQRMSDDPVASCPECGKEAERILSGGGGFLFKGEGFYITDYRSDSYKKAASKESGTDASGGEKGSKGGEAGASPSSGAASPASSSKD